MKKKIISFIAALTLATCPLATFAEETSLQELEQRVSDLEEKVASLMQLLEASNNTETEISSEPGSEIAAQESIDLNTDITIGDWTARVTGMEFSSTYSAGFGSYSADEGETFAIVHMTVTNNGTTASTFLTNQSFSSDGIKSKLYYQGKYEFSCANFLTADNDLNLTYVEPLSTKNGDGVFSISDTIAESNEEFSLVLSLGGSTYTFKL